MDYAHKLQAGHQLGPYRVVEPLGTGASATVYRCVNSKDEEFAVKVRKRGIITADRRFLREYEAMRSLRLPGVVRVFEAGLERHLIWFSMEVVRGPTILEFIHRAKSVSRRIGVTLDLGQQLLSILSSLHNAGFVHRDIKPSNVLVDETGSVKVLDFGISRYFDSVTDYTDPGMVIGTVPYMAPEQFAGLPPNDRVDVYASGLILYEAINGLRPSPKSPLGWVPLTTLERLPPLATLHREVPRALSSAIEHMLRVSPSERPSADEIAEKLLQMDALSDSGDWPEPIWSDIGHWWSPLEGLYGLGTHPSLCVLEGASGSGKHRIAEQVHRQGLLQGVWTLHVHCDVSVVGGPFIQTLHEILRDGEDEDWCRSVLGMDSGLLTTLWTDLPVQTTLSALGDTQPTIQEIAGAIGRTLVRASHIKRLILVIDRFEQVDTLTAATVRWHMQNAPEHLGFLLLHDDRWSSVLSHDIVAAIDQANTGQVLQTPPLKPHMATEITHSLCPKGTKGLTEHRAPQRAVEQGHQNLAAWRKEKWEEPPPQIWPFAVTSVPIPVPVYEKLCGNINDIKRWVNIDDQGIRLKHDSYRRCAQSRLANLRRSAQMIVKTWERLSPTPEQIPNLARLHLLAGDTAAAWPLVLNAALQANESGRYAQSRQWLMLLDTLPFPSDFPQDQAFELTIVRARVALITEQQAPRRNLLEHCERLAKTAFQVQTVGVLLADHQIRRGDIRSGLVTALRCASPSVGPDPGAAVQALGVATRCRLLLDQPLDARTQINRAQRILETHSNPDLAFEILHLDAEICIREGRHDDALVLAERAHQIAREQNNLWSLATVSRIKSAVHRVLGQRRLAEREIRYARNALGQSGDMISLTMAYMQLATLLVERGDSIGARKYFNRSIRRVRRLGLPQARPLAMKLQLDVATAMSQRDEAESAIAFFQSHGHSQDDTPASIVRYWRTQEKPSTALKVPAPSNPSGWGHLLWRLERARAALIMDDTNTASMELHAAANNAHLKRFRDLQLYFSLLSGYAQRLPPRQWKKIVTEASRALYLPLVMSAIELNASRFEALGKRSAAKSQWDTLYARAEELGYRPSVELARKRLRGQSL